MNEALVVIFQLAVLIFSVMIHEVSHGVVALRLGDQTAKNAGRLTLNPLKHIDPIGSFFLPLFLFLAGGPIFGWAKPVPYNPFNLKNPKRGAGLIGAAGPISNLSLALVFGILLRFLSVFPESQTLLNLIGFFQIIVVINIALAIFNLVPIPPLDGSNILFSFLPKKYYGVQEFLSRYGFYILLFLIFFDGFDFIAPVINFLFKIFTGA